MMTTTEDANKPLVIADGKLAEHWDVVDSLPRAVQLGLVPPPSR